MKKRLIDSVWIAEMLRGHLPADEIVEEKLDKADVGSIIKTLGDVRNEQE